MKKIVCFLLFAGASMVLFSSPQQEDSTVTIGFSKIVQHPALDAVEKGIVDVLTEEGLRQNTTTKMPMETCPPRRR